MRVWETVFVLLQLPVWLLLILRRPLCGSMGMVVPLVWLSGTTCVLALHLALEGWRWQTLPAEGCFAAGVWLTAKRWRRSQAEAGMFRRRMNAAEALLRAAAGMILLALLVLPWLLPVPRLEAASGPYTVGTRIYRWTDMSRQNLPVPGSENRGRRLLVQLWYPSSARGDEREAPYVPEPVQNQLEQALRETVGLPSFLTEYVNLTRTGILTGSPLAADGKRYPVVVFYHGWPGFGFTYHYLMAGLAARGYVVAGIDIGWPEHRSQSPAELDLPAWDKWIDDIWVPDERFVLDKLTELNRADPDGMWTGRLDLDKAAAAGHSFGGDAALAAAGQDSRFRAAISLDGAFYGRSATAKSPEQRVLRIATEKTALRPDLPRPDREALRAAGLTPEQYNAWTEEHMQRMQLLERDSPPLVLPGSSHSSFSDIYFFSPLMRLRDRGPDPYRIHTQVLDAVDGFLKEVFR